MGAANSNTQLHDADNDGVSNLAEHEAGTDPNESNVEVVLPPAAPTVLTGTAGDNSVTLLWDVVSTAQSYNLYIAEETFGDPISVVNYASLKGGDLVSGISGSDTSTVLGAGYVSNGTSYYFVITAVNSAGESAPTGNIQLTPQAPVVVTPATGQLNDTGIRFGANYPNGNNSDCTGENIAQQDCSQGRDVTYNDDSDGHAGFSFTKIDADGNSLPANASEWSCVQDNTTGLMWEVKTDDNGLHDKEDSYNWYNTNATTNGGAVGVADDNGDICFGYNIADSATYCNTEAFVNRVNNAGLCGANDWRVPDRQALKSIVNYNTANPTIDSSYFPNTAKWFYWSSSPFANDSSNAWGVNFVDGDVYDINRINGRRVRLVRDGK